MDDVETAKVISLVILFAGSFILGLLPIWVGGAFGARNSRNRRMITSALLCFGGGVLFSTGLTHILPETIEGFEELEDLEEERVGEITLCLGFILVYFVEEMVFACVGDRGHGHHGHGEAKKDGDSESASSSSSDWDFFSPAGLRDFVTVVALSFHAIMEGVAVGLEPDEDNVWQLFAAIACHKFVISFSFGLEMVEEGTRRVVVALYVFTFAAMTAIGIGIGLGVSATASESKAYIASSASLQGLAAGTLLYVALFEVLDRERKSKSLPGMAVLAFFVLGWTAMLMLDLFVTEPEEEEEEEVEAPEDEADARVFYSRLKKLSRLIQSVVN